MGRQKRGRFARGRDVRGRNARGGGGSKPFDKIEALTPDLFAQFRYPVYNNTQVLFRDPACTLLVTDAGVHTIGGVKSPFTGAIILTQADAAKRPLWMGPLVGANWDGIDDYFDSVVNYTGSNLSWAASYKNRTGGGILGAESSPSSPLQRATKAWPNAATGASIGISSILGDHLLLHTYDYAANDYIFRLDGTQDAQSSISVSAPMGDIPMTLGRWLGEHLEATVSEVAVWKRALTVSEAEIVEGVLQ